MINKETCTCINGIDENGFHCNQCSYFEDSLDNTDYELFDKEEELDIIKDYDFILDDDMF